MIAPKPFGIDVRLETFFGAQWFVDHLTKFVFQYHLPKLNLSNN